MITALTPEQEQFLPQVAAEWIAHGLSTQPADHAAAEAGVRLAYETAGLASPAFMIWLGSPLAGAFGQGIAPVLIEAAQRQVGDQVGAQVWDQVWDQVRAQVRDQVRDWSSSVIYPYWSVAYSAWFDAAERIGVTGMDRWHGHAQIARNTSGWWWARKGVAVLVERPTELHLDGQGRLHHETGPAIAYPDGWALHYWHGTPVPASLIQGTWGSAEILKERNAEVRRCAIEKAGWDWFITAAGLEQIGATIPDPGNPGQELALYDIPADLLETPVRVLLCTNGTPEHDGTRHRFGLTVPVETKSPLAGAAWTFGCTPKQYAQLQRAT